MEKVYLAANLWEGARICSGKYHKRSEKLRTVFRGLYIITKDLNQLFKP